MKGRQARPTRPPTHSSTGDTLRSGTHTGTSLGGRTPPSPILWRPHGTRPCGHGRVYPSGVLGQLGRVIEEWRHPLASHRPPPTPYKGRVWQSISDSLLYNMRGFKGAIITTTTTTIPGMKGRRARPPTHSSTGDTLRSGTHTGTSLGGRTPPSPILWRPHGTRPCGHGRVYPSGVLGQLGRVIEEWRHPLASHRPPPTPYKGRVWQSISDSLLYNMRGFKGAIITTTTTTIPGMKGRRARPPTHSSTGDTPRSGAHTGTGRGGTARRHHTSCGVRMAPGHADMGGSTLAASSVSSGGS